MKTSTFTLRAPGDDDIEALVALRSIDDDRAGDSWTTTAKDIRHEWSARGFDRDQMARIAEIDGILVGQFAMTAPSNRSSRSHGFVHPDHRGAGIGSALLSWGIDAARALGIRELFTHSNEQDSFDLIERAGFKYERTFLRMMNRHPAATPRPEWPEGVRLVALDGDELLDAVVEGLNGSFIDHWNFRPTDRDELAHELADPGEDPALWLVALGGDEVAGVNICHLKIKDGVVRGHIGPLGTTRAFRGIGLGRALLRHGLLELAARGAMEVGLGVDSESPSKAVGLYERNGFVRVSELRVLSRTF